ncbi:MAG TPA: hypothetical protein VM425_03580 [Myxococcota bacterium]|nr:hypothetical protein [Myxococcota bacterium]
MVDQIKALKNAQSHALSKYGCRGIGDILVEPGDSIFRVRLVELPGDDTGRTYEVDVDAASGDVRSSNMTNTVEGYYDVQVKGLIDGVQACDAALRAIAGYEHYDKKGRFTVRLQKDSYIVTFPLFPSGDNGARGADYAYQILVDGHTGEVGEILTAS